MTKIPAYQLTKEEILKRYNSSLEKGLSEKEARQRQFLYGKNKLQIKKRGTILFKFLIQFKELLVVMLVVAGAISIFLHEYRDAIVMFSIVIANSIIGILQEYKTEKILESLNKMVNAKAKVIRDGEFKEIEMESVVPGDIIKIEEGDNIPSDIRLIEENNLATNDFSLTGESNPVKKFTHEIRNNVSLGDRNNIAFMGTTVAIGNAVGVAIATGMETEIGKITNLSQQTKEEISPLQKEMNNVARQMVIVAGVVALGIFIIGLIREQHIREAFVFALAVAASCVPEGLPAQITVALSLGAGRLAKKRAIIKKLSAVETLGSTHIICSDKTGTLTKNEMTVQNFLVGRNEFSVTGVGYEPKGNILNNKGQVWKRAELKTLNVFFETGVLDSEAKIKSPDKEHRDWYSIGDPTEAALITLAEKAGYSASLLEHNFEKLKEFPFDAARKMMSCIRKTPDKQIMVYVKGAPLTILEKCTKYFDGEGIREINSSDKEYLVKKCEDYAVQALRVLAYAYKDLNEFDRDITMEETEDKLIFLGLVAMADPPREEVKKAIEEAKAANIRVIIITGDYAVTAEAVARKIGIGGKEKGDLKIITSKDLCKMSDIMLLHSLINKNIIFSRTSPEDKLRIVDLLKKAGEIIAVTGDGVNDAPALKRADIGVAMGKTGTEVAKESSEIILLDDSFAILVEAIKEGRIIYQNLKKTILSCINSNGGELFAVILSMLGSFLFNIPMAIAAIQILAIDLIGEMPLLAALAWDREEKNLMLNPPRNPTDHIINRKSLFDLGWSGFLMGLLAYLNFLFLSFRENFSWINFQDQGTGIYFRAMTLTYITIIFVQWANILSRRTQGTVISKYIWSNSRLLLGYALSFFFLLNISYNPYISKFLQTGPLALTDWFMAILAAFIFLIIREFYKRKTSP